MTETSTETKPADLCVITICEWSSMGNVEDTKFEPTPENLRKADAWLQAVAAKYRGFAVSIRVSCTAEERLGHIVSLIERAWRPTSVTLNVPGGSMGVPSRIKARLREK
jgi:hypothetical protein